MKLVSINPEHTKKCYSVALNLDIVIDNKIIDKLNNKLKRDQEKKKISIDQEWHINISAIENEDKVLNAEIKVIEGKEFISIPDFDKEHVALINDFLHEIETEIKKEKEERDNMLKKIAENTGLPLDNRKKARFL